MQKSAVLHFQIEKLLCTWIAYCLSKKIFEDLKFYVDDYKEFLFHFSAIST